MLDSVLPQAQTKSIKKLATSVTPAAPPMRVIKDEMATTPLPPSAGRYAKADPHNCVHPDARLKERANRTHKWFTCIDCGSRW
eukprot:5357712-Amphidinium_carterae.1